MREDNPDDPTAQTTSTASHNVMSHHTPSAMLQPTARKRKHTANEKLDAAFDILTKASKVDELSEN